MRGFANVGAVFGDAKKEELHPQIIRMARKSGQLNLSNKGLVEGIYPGCLQYSKIKAQL